MKKTCFAALVAACLAIPSAAPAAIINDTVAHSDGYRAKLNISFDARADFTAEKTPGLESTSGFHGRYFNLMVNGTIIDGLSYSLRQRLNKFKDADNDVFSGTDWVYLEYRPVHNLAVAAGKQVVLIGGYEYDAAPIDIFFASQFWNNIACYQFGASLSYISDSGDHTLTAQACNSPYQPTGKSCYAYNLFWSGRFGCLQTLWSANLIEYARGRYATFIALGNRLALDKVDLQLDIMNRASSGSRYWFADYSIIGQARYNVAPWLTLAAKGGYEDFKPMLGAPEHSDRPFYGGGAEFFPIPRMGRDVRVHAYWYATHNSDRVRTSQVNIGLKWRVDLYSRR